MRAAEPWSKATVVIHGGTGISKDNENGCENAARRAVEELKRGGQALEAAVYAVMRLEDDGRFNAGRGADIGIDGLTLEVCGSVMDTAGALGAIAGAPQQRVRPGASRLP